MITAILAVAYLIFGLSWLFGFGKPERLVKFIVWLIFGPILLGLFYGEWLSFYQGMPLPVQIAILIGLPFALLVGIRVLLPNSAFVRAVSDFSWNLIVYIVTFPIRLIWSSGRHITERERNRIRLERYRPAVGGRPPLRNIAQNRR